MSPDDDEGAEYGLWGKAFARFGLALVLMLIVVIGFLVYVAWSLSKYD